MSKLDKVFALVNIALPMLDSVGSALGYNEYRRKQSELKEIKAKLQKGMIDDQKAYDKIQAVLNSISNLRYMIDPRLISKMDNTMKGLQDKASSLSTSISEKANQIEQAVSEASNQQYGLAGVVQQFKENPIPMLDAAANFINNIEQPSSK